MSFLSVYSSAGGQGCSLDNKAVSAIRDARSKEDLKSFWDNCVLAFINFCCPARFQDTKISIEHKNEIKGHFWDLLHSDDEAVITGSFYKLKDLAATEFKGYFTEYYDSESDSWVLKLRLPDPESRIANEAFASWNKAHEHERHLQVEYDKDSEEIGIQLGFKLGLSEFKDAVNNIKIKEMREQCVYALVALKDDTIPACFNPGAAESQRFSEQEKLEALMTLLADGERDIRDKLAVTVKTGGAEEAPRLNVALRPVERGGTDSVTVCEFAMNERAADKEYKENLLDKHKRQAEVRSEQNRTEPSDSKDKLRANSPVLSQDLARSELTLYDITGQVCHEARARDGVSQQNVVEVEINHALPDAGDVAAEKSVSDENGGETKASAETVNDFDFVNGKSFKSYEEFINWWDANFRDNVGALKAFEMMSCQMLSGSLTEHSDSDVKAFKAPGMVTGPNDDETTDSLVYAFKLDDKKLLVMQRFSARAAEGDEHKNLTGTPGLCKSYWGHAIFYLDASDAGLDEERCSRCIALRVQKELYPPEPGARMA